MKKFYWVGIIISIIFTGCGTSENMIQTAIAETQEEIGKIQTAIAETEAAKPTATSTLAHTITTEPTINAKPTITQSNKPVEPSATLTPSIIPPTETLISSPTITPKLSPTACFFVIDPWCLSHQGCATVNIKNNSGSTVTIRIWKDDGSLDTTIYPPPGICVLQIRPGTYNQSSLSCGEYQEFLHYPMNDGWWWHFGTCP